MKKMHNKMCHHKSNRINDELKHEQISTTKNNNRWLQKIVVQPKTYNEISVVYFLFENKK